MTLSEFNLFANLTFSLDAARKTVKRRRTHWKFWRNPAKFESQSQASSLFGLSLSEIFRKNSLPAPIEVSLVLA